MKRGPKTLLTPTLQKQLCDLLADANTIKTACDACGIGERTFYDWCDNNPAFAVATRKARAQAKIKLVDIIRNAAKTNAFHAQWLLERSWPNEYARTERVEQIGENAEPPKPGVTILYETGGKTMAELLDFPIDPSMAGTPGFQVDSPEQIAAKQAKLRGDAPEPALCGS